MDEALVKIQEVEHKYGSISGAPLNCEELIHIRYMLGVPDNKLIFTEDIDDDMDEKIIFLYNKGRTYTEIGETIGHSASYVGKQVTRLANEDRIVKINGKRRMLLNPEFKEKLVELLRSDMYQQDVAKEMGISKRDVKNFVVALREYGIAIPDGRGRNGRKSKKRRGTK